MKERYSKWSRFLITASVAACPTTKGAMFRRTLVCGARMQLRRTPASCAVSLVQISATGQSQYFRTRMRSVETYEDKANKGVLQCDLKAINMGYFLVQLLPVERFPFPLVSKIIPIQKKRKSKIPSYRVLSK